MTEKEAIKIVAGLASVENSTRLANWEIDVAQHSKNIEAIEIVKKLSSSNG